MNKDEWLAPLLLSFEAQADLALAKSMEAYMKDKFSFYGVPSSLRKELFKIHLQTYGMPDDASFESIVRSLWLDEHRELQYGAQEMIKRKKWMKKKESIDLIEDLITPRSWWDTVDFLSGTLVGEHVQHHPSSLKRVIDWNKSGHLWLIRSSILFQLKYGHKTDMELLERLIVPHQESTEFFLQKAIGWALRQASKFKTEDVRSILERTSLKPLSVREASKYL